MVKRILIAHLVSNGDCLMVTALARQIKNDYPNCHLTWAISFKCKQVIVNNPYVDDIWEIKYDNSKSPFSDLWYELKKEISLMDFDKVFYTQFFPDNESRYDGTTRSSLMNSYPKKISVPIQPSLVLYDNEVQKVQKFILEKKIEQYNNRIIFECAPSSGQSPIDLESAILISHKMVEKLDSLVVIITSHLSFISPHPRIIDGSSLTFRENAELSKYCTFLVGCSSGISWLLTSDWAKKLPTIQIINGNAFGVRFASMKYDFDYWKINSDHIIETDICEPDTTAKIIIDAINNFTLAKSRYHKKFKPNVDYCTHLLVNYFKKLNFKSFFRVYINFAKRNNNWIEPLFVFLKTVLNPFKMLTIND